MSTADNPDLVGQEPDLEAARTIAEDLGQKLKGAREAQEVGTRELARQLNLTSNTVQHIENGEWEALGAPVYLKGYVDGLGRRLGVDVSGAQEYYRQIALKAADQERAEILNLPRPSPLYQSHRLLATVAATALLAIPAAWLVMGAFDGAIVSPSARVASDTAAVDGASAAPEPMLASIVPVPVRRSEESSLATPAPFEPVEATLKLVFAEQAWLEVRNDAGERLAYGLMPAGSEREFAALGLDVRVGNASTVTAWLDGAPFALTNHSRDELAAFRVGSLDED